jgi:ubiquinone/menaquinone biosynthesis C-methylase UbiE
VISTDFPEEALNMNDERSQKQRGSGRYTTEILDVSHGIDFPDESFDVVYAHLSLHYFTREENLSIVQDIKRILKQ